MIYSQSSLTYVLNKWVQEIPKVMKAEELIAPWSRICLQLASSFFLLLQPGTDPTFTRYTEGTSLSPPTPVPGQAFTLLCNQYSSYLPSQEPGAEGPLGYPLQLEIIPTTVQSPFSWSEPWVPVASTHLWSKAVHLEVPEMKSLSFQCRQRTKGEGLGRSLEGEWSESKASEGVSARTF